MNIPEVPGEPDSENDCHKLWSEICEQRWAEVQAGRSKLTDGDIVLAKAKARLEENRKNPRRDR